MQTVTIEVTTAKGKTQATLWGVTQERPYPDLHKIGSRLEWRGSPELFGACGQPPLGLGARYRVTMLRDGWEEKTATGLRTDYAGYVPYGNAEPVPGAITFRGRTLGEVTGEVELLLQGLRVVSWKVRGNEAPTASERALLDAQVSPALLAAIQAGVAELRAAVIAEVRADVEKQLCAARAALDRLSFEAEEAIAAL